jgi:hypothetical protein
MAAAVVRYRRVAATQRPAVFLHAMVHTAALPVGMSSQLMCVRHMSCKYRARSAQNTCCTSCLLLNLWYPLTTACSLLSTPVFIIFITGKIYHKVLCTVLWFNHSWSLTKRSSLGATASQLPQLLAWVVSVQIFICTVRGDSSGRLESRGSRNVELLLLHNPGVL